MSILAYNGAAIIAMCGKDCVGIAADTRLGMQQMTVGTGFQKIFQINDKVAVGLAGLATDVQSVQQKLHFRSNMYKLREEREMRPKVFANLVSTMLYERRFAPYFVEPVVAGLEPDNTPYISAMDLIGAPVFTKDFVVAGTASEQLYGTCETFFQPDLSPEDLFETLAQCLLAATDRDCLSGWGGSITIITPEGSFTRVLKARQD
eukprot:GILI01002417.1.p1 GENE.GILI01002417.1~~GILI01002417.1.p1  ORF type:complete len:205 (+),score=69.95 GILI01002417.1:108-722(+)